MTDEKLDEILKEALRPEINPTDLTIDPGRKGNLERKEKAGVGRNGKWIPAAASAAAVCLLLAAALSYGNRESAAGPVAKQEVKPVETAADTEEKVAAPAGRSQIYTEEEIAAAEAVVRAEFDSWDGVENLQLSYMGDSCNSGENIRWMNDLNEGQKVSTVPFTQCLAFSSTFHTMKDQTEYTRNPDMDYDGYQWWLARSDGGAWHLMTCGY